MVQYKITANKRFEWFNIQCSAYCKGYNYKRKNIETDLIERENFFSGTLNDMQTFVAVLKPTGEIIFVNNTPLEIIGKKFRDVEGILFYETPWWDYSEEVKESIKRDIELCAQGKITWP